MRVAGILVEPDRVGMQALAALAAEGKLRPQVERTFPLEEAGAAHALGEQGRTRGKLVLRVCLMARFVLVHGAFGGAWCWQPVVGALEAAGHTADALDLPGGGDDRTPVEEITLEACADRVRETLGSRPEDAVLVAHSMGGVVATQAAGPVPAAFRG